MALPTSDSPLSRFAMILIRRNISFTYSAENEILIAQDQQNVPFSKVKPVPGKAEGVLFLDAKGEEVNVLLMTVYLFSLL